MRFHIVWQFLTNIWLRVWVWYKRYIHIYLFFGALKLMLHYFNNIHYTQNTDLIESEKIICLKYFLWFEKFIYLNQINFVWFKQSIFETNKCLFKGVHLCNIFEKTIFLLLHISNLKHVKNDVVNDLWCKWFFLLHPKNLSALFSNLCVDCAKCIQWIELEFFLAVFMHYPRYWRSGFLGFCFVHFLKLMSRKKTCKTNFFVQSPPFWWF